MTSKITLAMAPERPVIRTVVNVINLSESMRCSIRSGDIWICKNGSASCRRRTFAVSSLLYFGSMATNSLTDAASTPINAVSTISITTTTMVMATGRLIPRRINQVTSGFRTMAKNNASNSCTMISAAAWIPARITTSDASLSRICMPVLSGWGVVIHSSFLWFSLSVASGLLPGILIWLLIYNVRRGRNETLL